MRFKVIAVATVAVLVASVGVAGSARAVPAPTVCVPHTVDLEMFPAATLRVTVRECSPSNDTSVITSVCKTETIIKTNGATAVVSDTCGTFTTGAK